MPKKGTKIKAPRQVGVNKTQLKKDGFAHDPPIPYNQFGGNTKQLRQFKAFYQPDGKGRKDKQLKGLLKDMESGRLYLANEDKTSYVELTEEQYDNIVKEIGERVGIDGGEPRVGKPYQGRTKDQEVIEEEEEEEVPDVPDVPVVPAEKPTLEYLQIIIKRLKKLGREGASRVYEDELPVIEVSLFGEIFYMGNDEYRLNRYNLYDPDTTENVGQIKYIDAEDINAFKIILILEGSVFDYGFEQNPRNEELSLQENIELAERDNADRRTKEKPKLDKLSYLSQKELVKFYKNIKEVKFFQLPESSYGADVLNSKSKPLDGNVWTTDDNFPVLPRFLPSIDRRNKQKFTPFQINNMSLEELEQFPDLFTYRWRDIWWVLSQMVDNANNVINPDGDDKFKFENENPKPPLLIEDELSVEEEDTEYETVTENDDTEDEDLEIVEIDIDGVEYFLDESTNKIYDPETQEIVGLKRFGGYDLSEAAESEANKREKKYRKKAKKPKKKKEPKFTEAEPEEVTVVGIRAMRGRRRVYLVNPPKFVLEESGEPINILYVYDAGKKIFDYDQDDEPLTKEYKTGDRVSTKYDFYKDTRRIQNDYEAIVTSKELETTGEFGIYPATAASYQIIDGYTNIPFDWQEPDDYEEDGNYSADEFDETPQGLLRGEEWTFENPPDGEISSKDADLVMELYEGIYDMKLEEAPSDPVNQLVLKNLRASYAHYEGGREEAEDEVWINKFKEFTTEGKLREEIFNELVEEILSGEVDEIVRAKILEEMGVIDSKKKPDMVVFTGKKSKLKVKKKELTQKQLDALAAARAIRKTKKDAN